MKYLPLSPAGGFLLASCLIMLGTAIPRGLGYGIMIALVFLIYLAGAVVRLGSAAFRFNRDRFQWKLLWNYGPSRGKRKNMQLRAPGRSPWGTRYVFVLKGTLYNGSFPVYSRLEQKVFSDEIRYELVLPLPGRFLCRGRLYISDIFGLVRFPVTGTEHREAIYHPPLLIERSFPQPRAAEENEENIKSNPANPEKVLMRDYQPGDLVRDINWKASGKFTSIYTRISPDQERSVARMTLVIRNEGTLVTKEPAASALLLGLKSISETILHSLRKENPECLLEVFIGEDRYDSRADDFENVCLNRISSLGRKGPEPFTEIPEGALVCTTMSDREIPRLKDNFGERVFVCTCSPETGKDLDYSLLLGNCLPRGELLRALLTPGGINGKLRKALAVRPDYKGIMDTGVKI